MSFFNYSLVLCIFIISITNGKFILPERNVESIQSINFGYPNQTEELDIIWRFDHSIHLEIDFFELDGQNKDFLLISDLPLTFEESFEEFHNSESYPPFLPESIITSHAILLSWNVNQTIQALSNEGTFIYFHAQLLNEKRNYPFKGFNITVKNLDSMRLPSPPPTTEATATTPKPNTPIYISKFLSCNPPQEFLERKNDFKEAIAEIATEYCNLTTTCSKYLTADFNVSDVNIPTEDGVYYCDPLWDVFQSCVEVKFAIVRVEEVGGYLMPQTELERMWELMESQIRSKGYCPFVPPLTLTELDSWIWMASMLALILFLMFPFCILWARNEHSKRSYGESIPTEIKGEEERVENAASRNFFDRNNPIYSVIAKMKKGSEESKYLEIMYSHSNENTISGRSGRDESGFESEEPASAYRPKVKQNVMFQENEDVAFDEQYDNQAYQEEEDDQENDHFDEMDERDQLDISQNLDHDGLSYQDRFLQIDRNQVDGNSDTEI